MKSKKADINDENIWQKIVDAITFIGEPIATNIKYAYLSSIDKSNVRIVYDADRKFIYEYMSKEDNLSKVNQVLRKFLDIPDIKVEYILQDDEKKVDTIVDIENTHHLDLQKEALLLAKSDPFIKSLIDEFSAKIINVEPIKNK